MNIHKLSKSVSVAALAISLTGCASLKNTWADVKADFSKSKPVAVNDAAKDMHAAQVVWENEMQTEAVHAPIQYASIEIFDDQPLSLRAVSHVPPTSDSLSSSADSQSGIQKYSYSQNSVFHVYTAPEQVTDIALEPGETLSAVSAGDTKRWIVGDTVSGVGSNRQVHILVKPIGAPLDTNLVITTSRRTYYLELHSRAENYMAAVSWRYAIPVLPKLRPRSGASDSIVPELADLTFQYKIKGDSPEWRPVRAFDDGKKVYIQFPMTLGRSEAPPLFVLGQKGATQLVNYRVKGRYYVVDRLFDQAELRLGEKKQTVVKIIRKAESS